MELSFRLIDSELEQEGRFFVVFNGSERRECVADNPDCKPARL